MNQQTLHKLLESVAQGKTSVDKAQQELVHLAVEDIQYAHIDHHRSLRKGFPEVIFGEGKTTEHIIGILEKMSTQEQVVLVTRVDPEKAQAITTRFDDASFDAEAKMVIYQHKPLEKRGRGTIGILSAGTSDIPVAKEAYLTADAMGNKVQTVFDVGVAGIHRLPSVVAGLVRCPVIAVPTSVGYGVSLGGLTALFGMLNSCSSNVAVVNIDNGFGAGYMASCINQT